MSAPSPDAWPARGYAHELVKVVREFSDAPDVFGLYSGLNVAGAAIGRGTSIGFGMSRIRGNQWTALVADSTTSRKSTTVRMATAALRKLAPDRMGASCTPEALIDELVEGPQRLVVVDELTSLLASMGKDFNAGLRESLTSLYAGDAMAVRTRGNGRKSVDGAHLGMLATTNAAWLSDHLKAKDLRGGFAARWVLVRAKSDRYFAFPPDVPPERWQALQAEMQRLLDVSRIERQLVWSKQARDLYASGRERIERTGPGVSPELAAVRGRLADAALKFALTVQLDELGGGDTMTELAVRRGLALADYSLQSWQAFMADDLAEDPHSRDCKRALDMLRGAPGRRLTQREITRATRWEARRIVAVEETLRVAGQLEIGTGQRKDQRVWVAVE